VRINVTGKTPVARNVKPADEVVKSTATRGTPAVTGIYKDRGQAQQAQSTDLIAAMGDGTGESNDVTGQGSLPEMRVAKFAEVGSAMPGAAQGEQVPSERVKVDEVYLPSRGNARGERFGSAAKVEVTVAAPLQPQVIAIASEVGQSPLPEKKNDDSERPITLVVERSVTERPNTQDGGKDAAPQIEARREMVAPQESVSVNAQAIAAKAADAMRHGEMHVGWRSEELGRVDIKAEVRGHEVAAAVKVESDAGRQWMTVELPKLAEALSRQEFAVRSLNVMEFGSGDSQGQKGTGHQEWSQSRTGTKVDESSALQTEIDEADRGLSIHV